MPIINLTTDLKSLHYGMDRPGGESSGQPFLFTGFKNININAPTINNPNGVGQNFLDIPTLDLSPLLNIPSSFINSIPGSPTSFSNSSFTIFKGNGIDVASPAISLLNTTIKGVTNVIDTTVNGIINTFDTTRNSNYPDFLLRKNRFNIAHSFADVVRVSKFFTTPSGIFFILKQNILERQNPKLVNRDRLYNPLNTVVQVGINSYGNHLNKSDIDPFQDSYYTGGTYGYFYSTRGLGEYPIFQTLSTGDIENRLTIAYTAKIANQDLGELTINPFGISYNSNTQTTLLSYPGGPGSVLGIGDTIIRIQNPTRPVNPISKEGKFQPNFYGPNVLPTDPLYLTPSTITGNWTYNPSNSEGVSSTVFIDTDWKSVENISEGEASELLFSSSSLNNIGKRSTRPIKLISKENKFQPNFYGPDILPTDPLYLTPNPFLGFNKGWTYDRLFNKGASAYFLDYLLDGSDETREFFNNQIFSLGKNKNTYLDRNTNYVNKNNLDINYNPQIRKTSGIDGFIYESKLSNSESYLIPLAPSNSVFSNLSNNLHSNYSNFFISNYDDPKTIKTYLVPTVNNVNWQLNKTRNYSLASLTYYNNIIEKIVDDFSIEYRESKSKHTLDSLNFPIMVKVKNDTKSSTQNYFLKLNDDFKTLPGSTNAFQSVFSGKNPLDPNNPNYNQYHTFTYKQIFDKTNSKFGDGTSKFTDFRKTIVDESNGEITWLPNTDYQNFNRKTTYKTSDNNGRWHWQFKSNPQSIVDPNIGISSDIQVNSSDDLIPFYFQTYTGTGTSNTVLFRAYLEDWSDNFKADWGGIKYMGRAESLYKYEGFSRDGSVTFNVPVLSAKDLKATYSKLNDLVNSVAPFYSTGTVSGLLTGVITRITMGDYWKSMPILMKDVGFTPINDMGWDIGRDVNGNRKPGFQLPKGIKVSANFIIIHSETPEYGINFVA